MAKSSVVKVKGVESIMAKYIVASNMVMYATDKTADVEQCSELLPSANRM